MYGQTSFNRSRSCFAVRLSPLTVQRQLRRGVLRGIKRGKAWRVPESALLESSQPVALSAPPSANGSFTFGIAHQDSIGVC